MRRQEEGWGWSTDVFLEVVPFQNVLIEHRQLLAVLPRDPLGPAGRAVAEAGLAQLHLPGLPTHQPTQFVAVARARKFGLAGVCIAEHSPQLYCRGEDVRVSLGSDAHHTAQVAGLHYHMDVLEQLAHGRALADVLHSPAPG